MSMPTKTGKVRPVVICDTVIT